MGVESNYGCLISHYAGKSKKTLLESYFLINYIFIFVGYSDSLPKKRGRTRRNRHGFCGCLEIESRAFVAEYP